jgi:hypothetical protein
MVPQQKKEGESRAKRARMPSSRAGRAWRLGGSFLPGTWEALYAEQLATVPVVNLLLGAWSASAP